MSFDIQVKSLTPVNAGWWAKFTDPDGLIWYSPVAAWALCAVTHTGERDVQEEILPVLTSEVGVEPHHQEAGYCEVLYLPESRFVLSHEPGAFAWFMEEENK